MVQFIFHCSGKFVISQITVIEQGIVIRLIWHSTKMMLIGEGRFFVQKLELVVLPSKPPHNFAGFPVDLGGFIQVAG